MGIKIRKTLSVLIMLGFTLLAFYVGIFKLFIGPLMVVVRLFRAGDLTFRIFLVNALKMFLSSTACGGIWCVGYIISHWFYSKPLDDGIIKKEKHPAGKETE